MEHDTRCYLRRQPMDILTEKFITTVKFYVSQCTYRHVMRIL